MGCERSELRVYPPCSSPLIFYTVKNQERTSWSTNHFYNGLGFYHLIFSNKPILSYIFADFVSICSDLSSEIMFLLQPKYQIDMF